MTRSSGARSSTRCIRRFICRCSVLVPAVRLSCLALPCLAPLRPRKICVQGFLITSINMVVGQQPRGTNQLLRALSSASTTSVRLAFQLLLLILCWWSSGSCWSLAEAILFSSSSSLAGPSQAAAAPARPTSPQLTKETCRGAFVCAPLICSLHIEGEIRN